MKDRLTTLERQAASAQQTRQEREQVVMLGKAAYALSGLLEAHGYQGEPTGEVKSLFPKQLAAKHSALALQKATGKALDACTGVVQQLRHACGDPD